MSTKKFKFGNADGNNVKGGRNNTRTILTAAGVIAFGATAGGVGYAAGAAHANPTVDDKDKPDTKPEENTEEQAENQSNQQGESTASQQTAQQVQTADNITEPQPTDTAQTQSTDTAQSQQSTNNNGVHESIDDVNPDLVAQQIIEEQNIDPYDIDSPTIISVDELATLYKEDGSEMLVAAVHTPDGAQYLLADIDGDGYFTDVFDMAGNYVGEVEGNLMASDLEIMVDESGEYIAQKVEEPQGEVPTTEIIDTPEDILPGDEEISDEELLAQLLQGGEDERLISDDLDTIDDPDDDSEDCEIDQDDIIDA
ncbi:MAG: hypothetical protein K2H97_06505 [Prevotella sp.]|nr:hypothetical protein [Prevotella sp.]